MDVLINRCVISSPPLSPLSPDFLPFFILHHFLSFPLSSISFPPPPHLLQQPPTVPSRAWKTGREACARAEPWKSSWKSGKVNVRSPHMLNTIQCCCPEAMFHFAVTFSFIAMWAWRDFVHHCPPTGPAPKNCDVVLENELATGGF